MRPRDMWFYGSPDNYVYEFLIFNYKYLVAEICARHNENASVNYDDLSGLDDVRKKLLKVNS